MVRVEDNRVGFAQQAATSTGFGLRTIRSRVALLNGPLELGSSPPRTGRASACAFRCHRLLPLLHDPPVL